MQLEEYPRVEILGNSEGPRHGKGRWSLSFAGLWPYMFVLTSLG